MRCNSTHKGLQCERNSGHDGAHEAANVDEHSCWAWWTNTAPSTWLPTNDTHAPAPGPSAHVEPVDDVAFVDPYCQHEDGTEAGCLEPAVRVVGCEYLCERHAALAEPDPIGKAIAAAGEDPGVLAMQDRIRQRLFGGGL